MVSTAATPINLSTLHLDEAEASINIPRALRATPYRWPEARSLPTRKWLLGHWLQRGEVTVIIAPGGSGKSTIGHTVALSLASGRELLGKALPYGSQAAWVFNLEDGTDELERQMAAACMFHGISREDCGNRLYLDSGLVQSLCTATEDREGFELNEELFNQLTNTIRKKNIASLIVDPFISSHAVQENSNGAIDAIAKRWKRLAQEANCAVVLIHHTKKLGGREVTAEDGRGAIALRDAARIVLTLNPMSTSEATEIGITDPKLRQSLVRIDTGKAETSKLTVQNIKAEQLYTALVPMPPLAEQHRIVAKVDELMALCDQFEAAQSEREMGRNKLTLSTLAKLNEPDPETFADDARFALEHFEPLTKRTDQIKQLRQTILNLAVRGKLVEQDPNDEPASELLSKLAKFRTSERRRSVEFAPIENQTDLCLPKGWAKARFGEVFSIRTGYAFKSSTYAERGTLILRVVNFDRHGRFDLSDAKFIDEKHIDDKIGKFHLIENDILMVMVGGTIGKTAKVGPLVLPALLNQNMWRIRSYGDLMSVDFAYMLVRSLNQNVENLTNSTHGHFAMGDYEQKVVPVPPLAEQHRIVAKVDELMTLCDELEASLVEGEQTRSKLLEAVLCKTLETS